MRVAFCSVMLVCVLDICLAKTYYVTPSLDLPCPAQPCNTLSQYASNSSEEQPFTDSNATLVFLSGNHVLKDDIEIANGDRMALYGISGADQKSVITCAPPHGSFEFVNVSDIEVVDLHVLGCKDSETAVSIVNASSLRFTEVLMQGNLAALKLDKVRNAVINRSTFSENGDSINAHLCLLEIEDCRFDSGTLNALSLTFCVLKLLGNIEFSNNIGNAFQGESSTIVAIGDITFFNSKLYAMRLVNCTLNVTRGINFTSNLAGGATFLAVDATFSGETAFVNNSGSSTGGLFVVKSTVIFEGNTQFTGNTGSAISSVESKLSFHNNSEFSYNTVAFIKGGGALRVISSQVQFLPGHHFFLGNVADYGGAMFVSADSQMYLLSTGLHKTTVSFVNNSAEYGGAIFVKDDLCTAVSNCFLKVDSTEVDWAHVDEIDQSVQLTFSNNVAEIEGGILFGGLLDSCSFQPFFQARVNLFNGNPFALFPTNALSDGSISSGPVRLCACSKGQTECTTNSITILHVWRGQMFHVSLLAVNQANHPVSALIRTTLMDASSSIGQGQSLMSIGSTCTTVDYTIFSSSRIENMSVHLDEACGTHSKKDIFVEFLDCPVGYILTEGNCVCDEFVLSIGAQCDVYTGSIIRPAFSLFWIGYYNHTNNSGIIYYPNCYIGYCRTDEVSLSLSELNGPDSQCASNRMGIQCGGCKPGFSVILGSSECRNCTDTKGGALILVFAVSGICLVLMLLFLNLTIAVGTINGLILYANILQINSAHAFPYSSKTVLSAFISWLNLDFGIQTCFYDGMDAYQKAWLQFVFPSYLLFIVTLIIAVCSLSNKAANFLAKRSLNPVATLATLVFLSYTKLYRIVVENLENVFQFYPDNSSSSLWSKDPSVLYAEPKRIPIIVVSALVLTIGLVYTLVIFLWQWLQKVSNEKVAKFLCLKNTRVQSFIETYNAPFLPKHLYWSGLLLIVRVIQVILYIILVVILDDTKYADSCMPLSVLIIVLALLYWKVTVGGVYKSRVIDHFETFFFINLILLSAFSLFGNNVLLMGNVHEISFYISVSFAILCFIGILTYHTVVFVFRIKDDQLIACLRCHFRAQGETRTPTLRELTTGSHPTYKTLQLTRYRETLLNTENQLHT